MLYFLHMAMGEMALAMGGLAIRDIVGFPVWWYTKGVAYMLQKLLFSAKKQAAFFAVQIWVRNLFVPMYGQYDWQSRIISFVVRLLQIIVRSFAYVVWLCVLAAVAVCYFVVPVVLVMGILLNADLLV